ncbi:MAG TPA: sulfatase-like hydrolase/transferase [Pyrinomonadaceae bacterium]|nr:sulfatase-like hydrolase/transferase [Pyrinomonadaceae bacterium]
MPNRREFIGSAVAATVLPKINFSQTRRRPNILFILADDLGYGDLSCYGRPDYQTPNLDRLATQGVRFVNAYSASPLCTPTRCAFITGRYPARTRVGLEEPIHEKRSLGEQALTIGLPREHPTVASLLKGSGYETALIGKWHLGYLPNFSPIKSGFDEFYGIMSGAADFFTHKDMQGDLDFYEGEVPVEHIGYMTDLLTRRAVEYISRRRGNRGDRPFYLSLHYTAPHWPWEGPHDRPPDPELRGPVAFRAGGSLKKYAEMMKSLDDGIGQVLNALSRAGRARGTIVVFTSDNGGERFSYHWPFTGEKGALWEGGIRVPAILRWPGVVPAGRISQQPLITMDWTATLIAAGKAQADPAYPLDGIDLLNTGTAGVSPALSAKREQSALRPLTSDISHLTSRTFFWRHSNQSAVLKGPWKYLHDGTNEYLFNLEVDQRERANFRTQNPAMFEQLKKDFAAWESTVLPRPPARIQRSSGL